MVAEARRVFVYGNFLNKEQKARRLPIPIEASSNAIEILREFSSTELVGKVYARTRGGNLQPVSPMGVRDYTWYQDYQSFLRDGKIIEKSLYFESQDGDYWDVIYFRPESDESGGYMAVALQQEGLFWLRDTEFRTRVLESDKVVAFIPSDAAGNKRTGVTVRVHDEDAARKASAWLPTDRIFFYHFEHGHEIEGGYYNERTKERIRII
jgi:hypothetical protein